MTFMHKTDFLKISWLIISLLNTAPTLANEVQLSMMSNKKECLVHLKKLATKTIGWNMSSIGPVYSVRMGKLNEVFHQISIQDTPCLFELLKQAEVEDNTREAIKYLLAMQGKDMLPFLEQNEGQNPQLKNDYFQIRQNMISQPWIKKEK